MCRWSTNSKHLWVPIVLFSLFLWMTQLQCQQMNDYDQIDSPAVLPLVTQLVYSQISNLTSIISQEISRESTFCVKDPDADWNQAFNFSTDLDFLASCIKKTRGDIAKRLCTAAEVKFFLDSLLGKSDGPVVISQARRLILKIPRRYLQELQTVNHVVKAS
ncbi:ABC transporter G family member 24-like, partial [Vigna radiata var. radiata]|uniref:ABC transporter G family member 24-like n=1 Tax=Vigna radiata var. radiata TaxID=3916 RepID=A0A3Q0FAA7_VIGRR